MSELIIKSLLESLYKHVYISIDSWCVIMLRLLGLRASITPIALRQLMTAASLMLGILAVLGVRIRRIWPRAGFAVPLRRSTKKSLIIS
jgi:uncharacterized protein YqfA (UPF0365 family)